MKDIKIITQSINEITYKGKPISMKELMKMSKDSLILMYRDDEESKRFALWLNSDRNK